MRTKSEKHLRRNSFSFSFLSFISPRSRPLGPAVFKTVSKTHDHFIETAAFLIEGSEKISHNSERVACSVATSQKNKSKKAKWWAF